MSCHVMGHAASCKFVAQAWSTHLWCGDGEHDAEGGCFAAWAHADVNYVVLIPKMEDREKKEAARAKGRHNISSGSDDDSDDGGGDNPGAHAGKGADPFFQHDADPFADPFFQVWQTLEHFYYHG